MVNLLKLLTKAFKDWREIDMVARYNVCDVCHYFLNKEAMTPKKLQKLLYFAYSWYLAMMNEAANDINVKLFDGRFEAWIHGPVMPSVYQDYKAYGAGNIEKYNGKLAEFTEDDLDVLDQVWDIYGKYNANQLEDITHHHEPWIQTRVEAGCSKYEWCNAEISDKKIFDFYIKKLLEE